MKVPPMPSAHLMVNLGEPFRMHDANQAVPPTTCADIWCMGLWTRYYLVEWPLPVRLAGVHFKPAGVYPFLQTPLFQLRDQVMPLETMWGRSAAELREQFHAVPTGQAMLARFEELLRTRLVEPARGLDMVQYAIGQIATRHGAGSIRAISAQIGVSANHLNVPFNRLVGIPPTRLSRICRFARVVLSMDAARPVDLSFLAHEAGYYDQSHVNKDFVAFTGPQPNGLLAGCVAASGSRSPTTPWTSARCRPIDFLQATR